MPKLKIYLVKFAFNITVEVPEDQESDVDLIALDLVTGRPNDFINQHAIKSIDHLGYTKEG